MLTVLIGTTGVSYALPECEGSPFTGDMSGTKSWNNCRGTHIMSNTGTLKVFSL